MGNRIFVGVVVLLWAGTMSWLMVARILPPFFHGEPPAHGGPRQGRAGLLGNRISGRADRLCREPGGSGRAGHDRNPQPRPAREESAFASSPRNGWAAWCAGWARSRVDTRTRLVLDSLGNLSSFETKVRLNDLPLVMRVLGRVDGPELRLKIQSGEITHEMSYPVPSQIAARQRADSRAEAAADLCRPQMAAGSVQPVPPAHQFDGNPAGGSRRGRPDRAQRRRPRLPGKSSFAACPAPAWRPTTRCGPWSGWPRTAPCCGRMST